MVVCHSSQVPELRLTRRPEGPYCTPLPGTLPCTRKCSETGPHGAGLSSRILGRLKRECAKYEPCLSFSEFKPSSQLMELSKTCFKTKTRKRDYSSVAQRLPSTAKSWAQSPVPVWRRERWGGSSEREGGVKCSFRQIYQQGAWVLTSHSRGSIPERVGGKEVHGEEAGLVNMWPVQVRGKRVEHTLWDRDQSLFLWAEESG